MRDALPGITSGDEDVIGIQRIATDEGEIVGRFHYLTGPAKLNRASLRKTFACPLLEPRVTIGAVVGLAGLVVFTADDQHVVVLKALKPEVVIRIECVPVQRDRKSVVKGKMVKVGAWRMARTNDQSIVQLEVK